MMGPAVESHVTGSGSVMDETTAPKAEPYLQERESPGSPSTNACSTRAPTKRYPCWNA